MVANQKTRDAAESDATEEKKRRRIRAWLIALGTVGTVLMIFVPVLLLRKKWSTSSSMEQQVAPPPSPAPTMVGDEECRTKRIQITEICNASGLDSDLVELKVLVNDERYWPKNVESDCLEGYGSYGRDACVVPESSLTGDGCFPLRNGIEIPFGGGGDEKDDAPASVDERIKITLLDVDFFWDDAIEIFAPARDWYRPNVCEKKEFEFSENAYEGSASIKMVVDFGEVEEDLCGVEEDALLSGLNDAAAALENVKLGLLEYAKGVNDESIRRLQGRRGTARRQRRRRLIFPLLASGFRLMAGAVSTGGRSFVKLFTRRSRASNALSTAADMADVGSFLLSFLGGDGEGASNGHGSNNDGNVALFDKVFDRFDEIDGQLDGIQVQIREGFEEIKLVVQGEFAEQELDEWITFRLGIKLRGDYLGFTDRSHTVSSRVKYEEEFRRTCGGDHSPYVIFQVLYSHACLDCRRFGGTKARQFAMDTYADLAVANFDDPVDRVLWFRRSFGTVMIGALSEAIYFYSACLHRAQGEQCDAVDPVRDGRLEEMGYALEEVVTSLGEAEARLDWM